MGENALVSPGAIPNDTAAETVTTPTIPQLDGDIDALTAALDYAEAGLYVLPVLRQDQGGGTGKNPGSVVGKRWQDKSSRDPKMIVLHWAAQDYGIAIDLGRSGLVVIDVDYPALVAEWLTNVVAAVGAPYQSTRPDTPGRGHYVCRQPPGRVIGCGQGRLAGMGLDVKGDGGVIIVQPTHHPEGGEYRWITHGEIPALPPRIAELLDDTTDRQSAATDPEVRALLAEHTGSERPSILLGWRQAFATRIASNGSRHDAMVAVLTAAMEEAHAGYYPAHEAATLLRRIFVEVMTQ
jgi:Bifunctional DNA primase/polymerase, N-terminal